MNILLNGFYGRMGKEIRKLCDEEFPNITVKAGIDITCPEHGESDCACDFLHADADVECIIDFSSPVCIKELLKFALSNKLPLVIGTTGHGDNDVEQIISASSQIPVFYSPNMSLGATLISYIAKIVAGVMKDAEIEIVEKHHSKKEDAPSGTAKMLFSELKKIRPDLYPVMGRNGSMKRKKNEIGIHSLRMGNLAGEHEIIFALPMETVYIRHEVHNRIPFAEGALRAAEFIYKKERGLYTMHDVIESEFKK